MVIETVSNRQGGELGHRRQRYQRIKVDYYVVYDPPRELGDASLQVFERREGRYVALERPWFESVGLGLVAWEGAFEGMQGRWLRWCTRDGQLVPTGAERAEVEKARALRLAARLRALGVDPDADG